MRDPGDYTPCTIIERKVWSEGLWTLRLDATRTFAPGQFASLAAVIDGEFIKRPYSIASPPEEPMAFFVVRVDGGRLTPWLWDREVGDEVLLGPKILGHFTERRVPGGGTLWMIGTGTGLAPYLSMLGEGRVTERFDRIVLVQGVRCARDLAYTDHLRDLDAAGVIRWVPALSREDHPGAARGRITSLLESGELEERAGAVIGDGEHHVMLCGNPGMVKSARELLEARGLTLHTPRRPGHVHIERYW